MASIEDGFTDWDETCMHSALEQVRCLKCQRLPDTYITFAFTNDTETIHVAGKNRLGEGGSSCWVRDPSEGKNPCLDHPCFDAHHIPLQVCHLPRWKDDSTRSQRDEYDEKCAYSDPFICC